MSAAVLVSVMHTAYTPVKLMAKAGLPPNAWPMLPELRGAIEASEQAAFSKYVALLDHDIETVPVAGQTESTNESSVVGSASPVRTAIETLVGGWSRAPRLTTRSLLNNHRRLMRDTPGAGQFRREGVCHVRCRYTGAVIYTPPPASKLSVLVDDLLVFAMADHVAPLPRAFVILLQLLLIHPFADGNGRCARALFAALCMRGGVAHPVALLALARLYGRGATRLHAGSAVLRATGDWTCYFDYVRQSLDEAATMWNERVATAELNDAGMSDSALHALWWKAMAG